MGRGQGGAQDILAVQSPSGRHQGRTGGQTRHRLNSYSVGQEHRLSGFAASLSLRRRVLKESKVPVLEFLEENIESTALFVYPTKALAQDQKQAMEQLLFSCTGLENVKVGSA